VLLLFRVVAKPRFAALFSSSNILFFQFHRVMIDCSNSFRVAFILMAALLSGCASIVSGRTATVELDSTPSDARVVIRDKHGKQVLTTQTPASVELRRKDRYFWPAQYTATFEKPGYEPKEVVIRSTVNPWVVGNVVFGGPLGLVVDGATGGGWRPKVASIDAPLEPVYTAERPGPSTVNGSSVNNSSQSGEEVVHATATY